MCIFKDWFNIKQKLKFWNNCLNLHFLNTLNKFRLQNSQSCFCSIESALLLRQQLCRCEKLFRMFQFYLSLFLRLMISLSLASFSAIRSSSSLWIFLLWAFSREISSSVSSRVRLRALSRLLIWKRKKCFVQNWFQLLV